MFCYECGRWKKFNGTPTLSSACDNLPRRFCHLPVSHDVSSALYVAEFCPEHYYASGTVAVAIYQISYIPKCVSPLGRGNALTAGRHFNRFRSANDRRNGWINRVKSCRQSGRRVCHGSRLSSQTQGRVNLSWDHST